jgi:hypothetical protein
MAYLVTTTSSNPLQNTIKFSLAVNFDKLRNNSGRGKMPVE